MWKSNNNHLKNITSKDNISKFYNTLQKLSQNIQDQKEYLNLSVDLIRIIFPSVEDESQPDDKDLDEGNDEEDFNQQQNQEENQAQKPEESQLEENMHTPENDSDNSQSSVQGEEIDIEISDQQIEDIFKSIDSYRNLNQNYKAATNQYDEIIEAILSLIHI